MKAGDALCDIFDTTAGPGVLGGIGEQHGQAARGGHAPHDDDRLVLDTGGTDEIVQLGDAEVDVGRGAPVQLHLLHAHLEPPITRRQVDERQPHGLLRLVGPVADEGDDARVRLEHPRVRLPARPDRVPRLHTHLRTRRRADA